MSENDYGFVLTRKVQPEPIYFTCTICQATKGTGFADGEANTGMKACASCAGHWGRSPATPNGYIGHSDRRVLRRLSAFTAALDWEVKNGQGRFRRYTAL